MKNVIAKRINLILLVFVTILSVVLYLWFIKLPIFQHFVLWVQQNLLLYFLFLIFLKILGIVWPPLPGGLFTLGSIPAIDAQTHLMFKKYLGFWVTPKKART